jgi:hypothetical protein
MGKEFTNIPGSPGTSELHRVPHDRAGQALAATPAAPRFGADDRDDLGAGLAQQGVGPGVEVVGETMPGSSATALSPSSPLSHCRRSQA